LRNLQQLNVAIEGNSTPGAVRCLFLHRRGAGMATAFRQKNRFSKVIALADVRFIYSEQRIQG
jgi:hypothetical protein